MDNPIPAPAAPDPNKITLKQVGAWLGGLTLSALATYTATRPATVPQAPPPAQVAPAPVIVPPMPATAPQGTTGPVLFGPNWQPAPHCHEFRVRVEFVQMPAPVPAEVVEPEPTGRRPKAKE